MRRHEMIDRARQEISKRVDLLRYHMGRPERVVRVHAPHKTAEFFFRPEDLPGIIETLRQRLPGEVNRIIQRAEKIVAHRADLLGYRNLDLGPEIDWRRDYVHGRRAPFKPWFRIDYLDFQTVGDSKVTWELNRHQHLVTLAKAYRLTRTERYAAEVFRQLYHWRAANPYPMGVNWASSLEVGFRAMSWLWASALLRGEPVGPKEAEADLSVLLATSGRHLERYLSTYFSPNTHLIGEAVALFFIGVLRPEIKESNRWKEKAWNVLLEEIEKQVHPDGVYFEQSVYYHVYAIDFFLHAGLLAARNGIDVPENYSKKIERMLEALMNLGQSGIAPRFGDDDGGRVFDPTRNATEHMLDPLATGAIAYGRGDFKAVAGGLREEAIWLTGVEGVAQWDKLQQQRPVAISAGYPDTGWYVMAHGDQSRAALVVDAGPQGSGNAGHGHADALSLQVFMDRECLLLDPGTGEYVGDGHERSNYRTSAAHNTLVIDGLSQSEPRGPFAWVRKYNAQAERWIQGEESSFFRGVHDGYSQLPQAAQHKRWIFHRKSHFWLVYDRVTGSGEHALTVSWHLGPNLRRIGDETLFLNREKNCGVGLLTTAGSEWSREFAREFWSPAYGSYEPASALKYHRKAALPCDLATLIIPVDERTEIGRFTEKSYAASTANVFSYSQHGEEQLLCVPQAEGTWSAGEWQTDAEFLYCHLDHAEVRNLTACHASFVEFLGRRVLSSDRRSEFCEVIRDGKQFRLNQPPEDHWKFEPSGFKDEPAMAGSTETRK